MAAFYKLAALATAETFDGTKKEADELVVAYPTLISIAKGYPEKTGANTFGAAATGCTASFVIDEAWAIDTAAEVTLTSLTACTANGNLSIKILGGTAVVVAITTAADTADKVATAIRNTAFAGWTVAGSGADVTFVQADYTGAILAVIDQDGEVLNAYADQTIVFQTEMVTNKGEVSKTEIWEDADFAKYFVAVGA